ncbi:hypothetical protein FBR04_12525 [Betaproteobacteria bacterium PRO7]|nr:hypothetical protein [Betaproteobacteria bacterium PRO7]
MSGFDLFIGVDYSGAETPGSRLPGLQVYAARPGAAEPERWSSPIASNNRQRVNWTRREIAERLRDEIRGGACLLAGIDHGFSFPVSYFARYGLKTWPDFLADFSKYWPTHLDHVYVDFVRDGSLHRHGKGPRPGQRVGSADEFRLTERWTSSAKSVFQLDGQGSVGKSTHAGVPWLRWLREALGDAVHFWPFDGWTPPPGKAVIAEVYPSIFRNRYPREGRSADEQDAYTTARWMADMSARGVLDAYFAPPLTLAERAMASLEGWILGVR